MNTLEGSHERKHHRILFFDRRQYDHTTAHMAALSPSMSQSSLALPTNGAFVVQFHYTPKAFSAGPGTCARACLQTRTGGVHSPV